LSKRIFILVILFFFSALTCFSQDIPAETEQQLENIAEINQNETTDDSYLQQLIYFKKHPLNLNTADVSELRELIFLTDLQIENFISYRTLLGKLISIYELQAVPSWDITTIKKILPYVSVFDAVSITENFGKRLKDGDQGVMIRFSEIIEKSKGYNESLPGIKYLGGKEKLFFRYRYQYKNLLQYGVLGAKDAGEQFFKGAQKYGFDFYSFHVFVRKLGKIQALALGDFTVNMGQGLIQWQSLAFNKSADVMGVKRQASVLRPYSSSGEFYFNRGAGITMRFGKIEITAFASIRKISAHLVADSLNGNDFISSFLTSGYHRTKTENANRNNVRQLSFGGNIIYSGINWHVGLNSVYHNFSAPIQKRNEPYNLFALSGNSWNNFSMDYSCTFRNFHLFGEAAADKNFSSAFINGLLISVDPKVDLSFVYRNINKKYQSVYGSAFTENTNPVNEKGFFAGISLRPATAWRLDVYADLYKFPWLKYRTEAPGYGKDFLAQITYIPNKQLEIYTRFRNESKQINQSGNTTPVNYLVLIPRQNWRTQITYQFNPYLTVRNRIEMIWFNKKTEDAQKGFLEFVDFIYNPFRKPYSGNIRLQYFETDGYNSRIYAIENDVLYSYSIPVFFDKGFRYYINLSYDLKKKCTFWLRWAQTIYHDKNSIGSGLDEITGNHRSEIKLQCSWFF
jgi:hypothetical protein